MPLNKRQGDDLSAPTFDLALADDIVRPIGAFHENVRMDRQNGLERGIVLKPADEVDHFESVQDLGAFLLGNDGPRRAFDSADGGVAIYCHNKSISQFPGSAEQIDMSRMQDVKASVRKDNAFAGRLQAANLLSDVDQGRDHLLMIASRFFLFPMAGPYG
jgi:hypothetical protein